MNACMQALMSAEDFVDHYLWNGNVIAWKLCEMESKAYPGVYFTELITNFLNDALLNPHEDAFDPTDM